MATLLLIIIYLAFISLGLPDSLLGTAWPAIMTDMSLLVSYAGILSVIISGGTIISSVLSERIIRRFGTGKVTAVSVTLTAIALLGFSLSRDFWVLCILSVPLGLGAGSVDASLNNFVALHYKASHMSWLHCFWGVGATAGPMIMSFFLAGEGGWKSGYRTIGIIQVCLIIILFISLPLWRKVGEGAGQQELSGESAGMLAILGKPGAKPALLTFFSYCAVEAAAGLWGGSYLVLNKGITAGTAAKWVSMYYFGITLGRFAAGFIAMKMENRTLVRLGQGIIAAGLICILLPLGKNSLLPAGFLLMGIGCAPVFPCLLHETPKRFGKDLSQALMGIQMASAYAGATAMPPLFGLLAQHFSFTIYPYYLLVVTAMMIVFNESTNRAAHSRTTEGLD
ncbi:glucose/mannose transporter GlcP [Ruminiclostridium hungatei]|uniref:Glucose/mannose transporter GlcP n=1 Tax=Ruminiclostridium hungatei TaxID=48256 RepID=A0A1V4SLT5_RUMHU|nr:MFS transporter [Ruminiclostridium hungatei]OPX44445.1 glucose/mannose transporter GlcP [Ruminiclostridium hungatei]